MVKPNRVTELASAAEMDLDEALVTLWDSGIEYLSGPDSVIRQRDLGRARSALQITSHKDQLNVDYWLGLSGLTRDQFVLKLSELGVTIGNDTRRVPKGSLRRLRVTFTGASQGSAVQVSDRGSTSTPPLMPLPLVWESVGRSANVSSLSEEEVRAIHEALELDFANSSDPISPPGVRDDNLLASAISRPNTGLGDQRKYPTVEMAVGALFHSLIHNHPFFNGNKRTALVALLAMLDRNGLTLTYSEEDVFKFTLRAAQHSLVPPYADQLPDREALAIARWIKAGSRAVTRGERPLKWIQLRRVLSRLGCTSNPVSGGGNRIMLERKVTQRRRFRTDRVIVLSMTAGYAGEGTEVSKGDMHNIRRVLELDEAHGVDSTTFYDGAAVIDSFIAEYCSILERLARL